MITGELQNKVDKICETFWTGGITNPLEIIEQFNYLLFIKNLDEAETNIKIFSKHKQYLRWSQFKNKEAEEMYDVVTNEVFPFIKTLHGNKESAYTKYMSDAIFKIPTPQMLSKLVGMIDTLPMTADTKGDLYEYLLSKVATAGTNGQFRTPRHIIDMIVKLMKPTPSDVIVDPSVGSAGFLVSAQQYLRDNYANLLNNQEFKNHFNNEMFYGFDIDRTMLRISAMNMMLHGVDNPNIEYKDSLSEQNKDEDKYTLILANPPFKGSLDYEAVSADLLKVT